MCRIGRKMRWATHAYKGSSMSSCSSRAWHGKADGNDSLADTRRAWLDLRASCGRAGTTCERGSKRLLLADVAGGSKQGKTEEVCNDVHEHKLEVTAMAA